MSILMKKHEENKITVHLAEVKTIGQAFADEIFRVFRNKHKEITILPINMNQEVKFMIKRVDKNIVME